jgi:hypothetical protein
MTLCWRNVFGDVVGGKGCVWMGIWSLRGSMWCCETDRGMEHVACLSAWYGRTSAMWRVFHSPIRSLLHFTSLEIIIDDTLSCIFRIMTLWHCDPDHS